MGGIFYKHMIRENKLPEDILLRLPGLVNRLRETDDVNALFYFGSLVHGGLKPLSDLDLAVLLTGAAGRQGMMSRELQLAGLVEDALSTSEFDLVVLNTAPLRFAYTILKEGRLVFVKDTARLVDFREKTVKLYLDFRYYRDEFDREYCRRIGYNG
jgi:predicted nucleotidyltransferase